MAKKLKIRVVRLVDLLDARAEVEKGHYDLGADYLGAFCKANPTMRGEHGELWGDVKIAAFNLRKLVEGQTEKAQAIIGQLWRKVFPNLTEARAMAAK